MIEIVGLRIAEFCSRYGVSRATAYREMKAGRLKSKKFGRRGRRIDKEDADNWFKNLPSADGDDPPSGAPPGSPH